MGVSPAQFPDRAAADLAGRLAELAAGRDTS